ncbi:two-component system response regulator YesN [Bacillus pakistanensis]|uniref:Two-component system response regulator YesN n=1 Tax=Rossellomorea pakistanensis TaxID=992288 RepID=A0ABS2NEW7_9BACI|nr:helix-turn-helix domain-containing protein [Bacillus pakistanensis]MBM7586309.1 two-component system response regulator YesN [Bacillus pakistanensis]
MKAIIIDDEKHVREGLLLLGEWQKYGINTILEAENGDDAITLISEHGPEIIFTDMRMPKRDGISLIKWLHASDSKSKTIVVSGYDDYEYMRNAICYKSFDYILKPIDPGVLNKTLERAVKEWKEQALSRNSQKEGDLVINEVKSLYWDRLFSLFLTKSQISKEEEKKIEKEYSIKISKESCTMAVISLKPLILKQFQGDTELAFSTITNICNELLRKQNDGVSFRNINQENELVILFWREKNIAYLIDQIYLQIYQYNGMRSIIALGHEANQFKSAYESAKEVFLKHDLTSKNRIVTSKEINSRQIIHLLDFSQDLKWAIRSGSLEQVETLLNCIFTKIENSLFLEQLEDWDMQFELLQKNWLNEYEIHSSNVLYRGSDYWKDDGTFSFQKFKDEKKKEFLDLIKTLTDAKYQKEKNSMQKIEEYLQQNYQQDINLKEIADRFYLSREYISRKFKQDFNETITDYLTKIRLEKAKELLENPYLKIYEIAYSVGYQNEKYFSKVFKKLIGLTPNEYRGSK